MKKEVERESASAEILSAHGDDDFPAFPVVEVRAAVGPVPHGAEHDLRIVERLQHSREIVLFFRGHG